MSETIDFIDVQSQPVLDIEGLHARIGGNLVLLEKLAGIFDKTGDQYLFALREALMGGDAEAASGAAHSLKGAASSLGGMQCAEVAKHVEHECRAGRHDISESVLTQLAASVDELKTNLRDHLEETKVD